MKKRLQDEMAKALMKNGAPLSISEYGDLVSKVKAEVAQTLAETVEPTELKGVFLILDLLQYLKIICITNGND